MVAIRWPDTGYKQLLDWICEAGTTAFIDIDLIR